MGDPDEKRFAFQARAAAVQREASALVMAVSELFTVIFATRRWPEESTEPSRSWNERGAELVEEWKGLEPPPRLEPLWKELEAQFGELAELIAAAADLRRFSKSDLVEQMVLLQAAFNRLLQSMNETEARLLNEERALQRLSRGDAGGG